MKMKKHMKTSFARFEILENRMMPCEIVPMLASVPERSIDSVVHADVAAPIIRKEITIEHKGMILSDMKMQQAARAVALQEILAENHDAKRDTQIAAPTDGLGDVVHKVWSGIKSVSPAAMLGDAIVNLPRNLIVENSVLTNASKINISDLRPGDVIVFSGSGLVRAGIKAISASNFNHAAIYLGGDKLHVIDATDGAGVSIRSLSDAVSSQNTALVLRIPGLSSTQMQKIVDTAKSWVGAKYSYTNLWFAASGFVGTPENSKPAVVCSQFVQLVYQENGISLTNRDYPSPGDLLTSRNIVTVGLIKTNGWNPVGSSGTVQKI